MFLLGSVYDTFFGFDYKRKSELSERVVVEEKLGTSQCSRYLKKLVEAYYIPMRNGETFQ